MSSGINCDYIRNHSVAEAYLNDRLGDLEREAYELHYFECARCFEELALLKAIREEAPALSFPRRRPLRWMAASTALIAASLAVGSFLMWNRRPTPLAPFPPPTVAKQLPEANAPAASPKADYAQLAVLEPPQYAPVRLRGGDASGEGGFASAMELYQQHNYTGAMKGLAPLAAQGRPDAGFYLAACRLLTGDPAGAESSARRVVEAGDTPFLEESRWVLAKAMLAQNHPAEAKEQLLAIVRMKGDFDAKASALLSRINELRGQ